MQRRPSYIFEATDEMRNPESINAIVKNRVRSNLARITTRLAEGRRRAPYLINRLIVSPLNRLFLNPLNRFKYSSCLQRSLEIGPGPAAIAGFETMNVIHTRNVTYVGDACQHLPFSDGTFDVIYASHIIEHISWFQVEEAIKEWVRILKPGGTLEIWVPNGLKIAKAFVEAEERGLLEYQDDGWRYSNDERDPCKWAAGRVFSYGDGSGGDHPNWHRALFSPRYLKEVFRKANLTNVREMDKSEVRAYDHGWINLGVCGT